MRDDKKTKEQLLLELKKMRKRISELEKLDFEHKLDEKRLLEYHKVVESLNDMIAIVDRNYTYLLANNALLRHRNTTREQVVGHRVKDVVGRDIFELVIRPHLDSCLQGNVIRYEMKYRYPELGERDLLVSYFPIEEAGQITRVASVIRDITESKRAEEAIKEAHRKLQATLRAVPDLMFEMDREGRIYDYHAPEHETLYVGPEVFLGKTVREVLPESAACVILEALAEADQHGWHSGASYSLDLPAGRNYYELSVAVKDETGVAQKRFLALARDITKRRQAEEALKESELQFRLFLEHSPVYVFFKDDKIRSIQLSKNYEKMLGRPLEDLLGRTMDDIFPSDLAKSMIADDLRILRDDRSLEVEEEFNGRLYSTIKFPITREGKPSFLAGFTVDITDRRRAEESLKLDEERLETLLQLTQLKVQSEKELTDFALEAAVRLTKSKGGYLHFFNEDERTIQLHSWSKEVLNTCTAVKEGHYSLDAAGLWADSIRQRRTVIHNDYQALTVKKGYPEGHFHLVRHLGIPVFDGDRIVGAAGVGNKEEPYNESDARQITLFMNSMWGILKQRRSEEERELLILELKEALAKIKTLSGLLPICASCKKIRDDKGYWNQIEVYVHEHSEAEFSHGICPECVKKLYPQIYDKIKEQDDD